MSFCWNFEKIVKKWNHEKNLQIINTDFEIFYLSFEFDSNKKVFKIQNEEYLKYYYVNSYANSFPSFYILYELIRKKTWEAVLPVNENHRVQKHKQYFHIERHVDQIRRKYV